MQAWEIISKELKKQGISFISTAQVQQPNSQQRCCRLSACLFTSAVAGIDAVAWIGRCPAQLCGAPLLCALLSCCWLPWLQACCTASVAQCLEPWRRSDHRAADPASFAYYIVCRRRLPPTRAPWWLMCALQTSSSAAASRGQSTASSTGQSPVRGVLQMGCTVCAAAREQER